VHGPEDTVKQAAAAFARLIPLASAFMNWLGAAAMAAILGVIVGGLVDRVTKYVITPLLTRLKPTSRD
jgi:predicted DNA repair protein MutK